MTLPPEEIVVDENDLVAEVDWVSEEPAGPTDFWRSYLRRQMQRSAVVLLIVLGLFALGEAGRPGQWVLGKIFHATRADFSVYLAGFFDRADLRGMAGLIRRWLAGEWQVVGPEMRQAGGTPVFAWPVTDPRPMSATQRTADESGLDLVVPAGQTVLAAETGQVTEARQEKDGSMTIVLRHQEGWRTVYGQCGELLVVVGEQVASGQPIALVGTSPPPTPTHLHFEIWDSSGPVDPTLYLKQAASVNGLL